MIIDAHQHFWNLDKVSYPWLTPDFGPIHRNFEASELQPHLQAAGIDRTIIVQSMNSEEDTEYMLNTAAVHNWVGGVVGWVPLNEPQKASQQLYIYAKNPLFKGVRHLIHEEADPDWIVRDEVIEGLRVLASFGMTFDVVAVFPNHLKHVPTLAEKVPDLKIVIDHLAKPPIADRGWEPWASQFARAAEYPFVHAKVSGLNTAAGADWSGEDLKPYIDFTLEKFGANRMMFGSDWPVAILAGNYAQVWNETKKAISGCTSAEIDAILGGTAAAFYGVNE
jgi:L-fuconolactonase